MPNYTLPCIPPEPDALQPPVSVYAIMQLHTQQLAASVLRSLGYDDDSMDQGINAVIDTTVSKRQYR